MRQALFLSSSKGIIPKKESVKFQKFEFLLQASERRAIISIGSPAHLHYLKNYQ